MVSQFSSVFILLTRRTEKPNSRYKICKSTRASSAISVPTSGSRKQVKIQIVIIYRPALRRKNHFVSERAIQNGQIRSGEQIFSFVLYA